MFSIRTDDTSDGSKFVRNKIREMFWLGPVIRLVDTGGCSFTRRDGYQGSNPGSGENPSLQFNKKKQ